MLMRHLFLGESFNQKIMCYIFAASACGAPAKSNPPLMLCKYPFSVFEFFVDFFRSTFGQV